jgi:polysaccharide deacetylase 2 family uncharacterized protein YibQ
VPLPRPPAPLVVVDQAAHAAPPPVVPAPQPAPGPTIAALTVPPAAIMPPPPKGVPAWQAYARAAPAPDGRPRIAIVIDDVGTARRAIADVMALPAPVTISVMTYVDDAAALARSAAAHGHEVMLHVPMQPEGSADPGPNALLVGLPAQELERRIAWNLDRAQNYVGINNHMGSRFTADRWAMVQVMMALKARGLMYLDSRTSAATKGQAAADESGVPAVSRDVFLDDEIKSSQIDAQLALTEAKAKAQGTAIAIGHPHPETLAALQRWLPQLEGRGFVVVPVTAILRQRMPAVPPS